MSEEKWGSDLKSIGKRVKILRTSLGMTQEQLGGEVFQSREWVNKIERGAGDMKTGSVIALAKALQTTCDYLLLGVQSENVDIFYKTGLEDASIEALKRYRTRLDAAKEEYLRVQKAARVPIEACFSEEQKEDENMDLNYDEMEEFLTYKEHLLAAISVHFCNKFIQNESLLKSLGENAPCFWLPIKDLCREYPDRPELKEWEDAAKAGARFILSRKFDDFIMQEFENCEHLNHIKEESNASKK